MKTSKQKCLEMWQWLELNPVKENGQITSKKDYYHYLKKQEKSSEFEYCWACVESIKQSDGSNKSTLIECTTLEKNIIESDCRYCPIKWGSVDKEKVDDTDRLQCVCKKSPYFNWGISIIPQERKKYAEKIVKLIKETWKE